MNKDEALDLALEALSGIDIYLSDTLSGRVNPEPATYKQWLIDGIIEARNRSRSANIAIKQARALDKMADNAKELGLDYEPVDGTQVSKVWWDGEKLMAKPIPLEDIYLPAPAQEPIGTLNIWFYKGHGNYDFDYWGSLGEGTYTVHAAKSEAPSHNSTCNETLRAQGKAYPRTCKKCGFGPCVGKPKSDTTPQRPWTGLSDEDIEQEFGFIDELLRDCVQRTEAKLKEKNGLS